MTNAINFYYGSLANYQALASKDVNTLYFVDGVIYKGSTPFSTKVVKVSTLPEAPATGVIYVLPDYTTKFYNGSTFETINVGTITAIDSESTDNDAKTVSQGAVKAYVAAQITGADVDNKIATAKSEAISDSKDYTDGEISSLKSTLEGEISEKVASVFRFKGSKATLAEVEALTDMVTGDVWNVTVDGKEYVYTGSVWELLGFTIDLSAYAKTEDVTTAINNKATEIINTINAYNKSEVDALIKGVTDVLNPHVADTTVHITAEERETWNAKATTTQVSTAKEEAISSATTTAAADATTKANAAEQNAKNYADGLDSAMNTRVEATESALTWKTIATE